MDMDTPAAYEELKAFYQRGMKSESLEELTKGRNIVRIKAGSAEDYYVMSIVISI